MPDVVTPMAEALKCAEEYVDACRRFADSDTCRQARKYSRVLRHMADVRRQVRDRAHRDLLDALMRLEDAGQPADARNLLRKSYDDASLAETKATRAALSRLKG